MDTRNSNHHNDEQIESQTPKKVYIAREQISNCRGCDREEDLRFGHCFDCANVQSVILEGLDMNDIGLDGKGKKAEKSLEKVRLLYQLGLLAYAKPSMNHPHLLTPDAGKE